MAIMNFNAGCTIPLRPWVLATPQIPKPMHTMAPRTVFGQEWWDIERKKAYAKTNDCCIACGVHKTKAKVKQWVEAHELYNFDYPKGKMIYLETVPLCHLCHNYIHFGRVTAVHGAWSDFGIMVKDHGDSVLKKSGFEKSEYRGCVADWEDWRLVIDGKEYKGKFKDYADWQNYFSKAR